MCDGIAQLAEYDRLAPPNVTIPTRYYPPWYMLHTPHNPPLVHTVGDLCAQLLTPGAFDVARVLRLGAYGCFLDGPVGHTFYKLLDDKVGSRDDQSNPATILTKTAIDQLIYAPIMTVVFFVFLRFLEVGWQPDALLATMDRVVPTLLANYCIWPFAHYVSFRWIPTDYRILYNNVISVCRHV